VEFASSYNSLYEAYTERDGAKGVFKTTAAGATRHVAWCLRTLAQAITVTPDSATALKAALVTQYQNNINYYHGRYVATANNPLGLVQPYDHYNTSDAASPWLGAAWMDDFFTATFGYTKDLSAHSSTSQTKLDQFLAWKYKSVVGRLGGSGTGEFSYRYAAQYNLNYAPSNAANFATGAGPWYSSWGAVARAMNLSTSGNTGDPLESGSPTEPTAYWGNLMPEFVNKGQGFFGLGPYFNIFPIFTIILFLWQQKMFMPPPTDEQTAMQQKMMKYMMIFMGFMFFKVPAGLCVYFISSSLWSIAERKFLPKPKPSEPMAQAVLDVETKPKNGDRKARRR